MAGGTEAPPHGQDPAAFPCPCSLRSSGSHKDWGAWIPISDGGPRLGHMPRPQRGKPSPATTAHFVSHHHPAFCAGDPRAEAPASDPRPATPVGLLAAPALKRHSPSPGQGTAGLALGVRATLAACQPLSAPCPLGTGLGRGCAITSGTGQKLVPSPMSVPETRLVDPQTTSPTDPPLHTQCPPAGLHASASPHRTPGQRALDPQWMCPWSRAPLRTFPPLCPPADLP